MSDIPLVIYHGPECPDGFCAALAAWLRYGDAAEYVPAQYGEPPPEVRGRCVDVLDFSYSRRMLKAMNELAETLLVLDHHKTAEAELAGLPYCRFHSDRSGAMMAWEHYHPDKEPPRLFQYVQDRDLWRWALPKSREVSAAIASYPKRFNIWAEWLALSDDEWWSKFAADGEAILRYQEMVVAQHVARATETEMGGHKIPMVNATLLQSEIAGKLAEGRPFGAVWFTDGRKIWSLRSRDDGVDVSVIAAQFGGGGHKNSAGFSETVEDAK